MRREAGGADGGARGRDRGRGLRRVGAPCVPARRAVGGATGAARPGADLHRAEVDVVRVAPTVSSW